MLHISKRDSKSNAILREWEEISWLGRTLGSTEPFAAKGCAQMSLFNGVAVVESILTSVESTAGRKAQISRDGWKELTERLDREKDVGIQSEDRCTMTYLVIIDEISVVKCHFRDRITIVKELSRDGRWELPKVELQEELSVYVLSNRVIVR